MLYFAKENNVNKYNNVFLKNAPSFNGYLLYGQDKGQVRYRALQIIDTIKSSLNSDVIKVSLEDIENNKFIDLINQKIFFLIN